MFSLRAGYHPAAKHMVFGETSEGDHESLPPLRF